MGLAAALAGAERPHCGRCGLDLNKESPGNPLDLY